MPYSIRTINPSLIKINLDGDIGKYDALRTREELESHLETSWMDRKQVNIIADVNQLFSVSAEARHLFASQNRDKRIGRIAVIGFNRAQKVMAHFVMVESKRSNIYFFDTTAEAESWLLEKS